MQGKSLPTVLSFQPLTGFGGMGWEYICFRPSIFLPLYLYIYIPNYKYSPSSAHNRHLVNIIIVTSVFASLSVYVYSTDGLCMCVFIDIDHKQDEYKLFLSFWLFFVNNEHLLGHLICIWVKCCK